LGTLFPDGQLIIKAWKELLILVALVLVAIEVTKRSMWQTLWNDMVIRLSALFVFLHFASLLLMWNGAEQVIAGLMIDLRFVAFFVAVYVACRLYPVWRTPLLIGGVVAAAVSLVFAVLQVTVLPNDILAHIGYGKDTIMPYLTVDQNDNYVRINGTLRGPNPLGIFASITLVGSVAFLLWRKRGQYTRLLTWAAFGVAVMSVVALWFSYSRSALIAAVLAVAVVLAVRYSGRVTRPVGVALVSSLLLMAGLAYVVKDMAFVSHVVLHEDPNEAGVVNSNDEHVSSLVTGIQKGLQQPVGAGIGSTGSPSLLGEKGLIIENYFLYVAHEVGWLGLIVFVILNIVILRRMLRARDDWLAMSMFASGIGIAVACIVLPVWADDTVALVWWGLAGVALAGGVNIAKEKVKRGGAGK
jgi:hypothetical protein